MPEIRHRILATAGHVDHGKSALVKALTGTDPDRLPEEKARGITIDLGFAHLELASPNATYSVGIVDVPGHEDFVKNMVAGVGGIDVALFVVAADDGWMPQSEEHLQILEYLGVTRAVVALTKADLAAAPILEVIAAVRAQLRGSPFADAPIVPTTLRARDELPAGMSSAASMNPGSPASLPARESCPGEHLPARMPALPEGEGSWGAPTASRPRMMLLNRDRSAGPDQPSTRHPSTPCCEGLDTLRCALVDTLDLLPSLRDYGKPRLAIDRVFTLRGLGTVVTGTLRGGRLESGQAVQIQPTGRTVRIRSLQTHLCDVAVAVPGSRVALNIPEVPIRSESQPEGVARGQTVTTPDLGQPTRTLDVVLEKSSRLAGLDTPAARRLRQDVRVRLHCGTANVPVRIRFPAGVELAPGTAALAELRCESPVFVLGGDRFLLRDWSEQHTLAGGRVLEAEADPRRWRSQAQRRFLEQRRAAPKDIGVWLESLLARDGAVRRVDALRATRFAAAEITAAAEGLIARAQATARGGLLVHTPCWLGLRTQALDRVDAGHRDHSDQPGLPLTELRSLLEAQLPFPDMFDPLVADLCIADCRQVGSAIARVGFRPALPPNLQAAGQRLRLALTRQPFDPPSRRELAPDSLSEQALRYLVRSGEAIELNADLVLDARAYEQAVARILDRLRNHGPATVSDLRQALGSSRRVMIPLLERLDRQRLTRRDGDRRCPA
jgi:selenocysteine-specific elongation factor